jgi:hypothetical protein
MDRIYGTPRYTSKRVIGIQEGYEGYELTQVEDGETRRVVRVVFWDAGGRFYLETFDAAVCIPLEILEELIAETKANVEYS